MKNSTSDPCNPSSNIFQIQPANMTDARNLIARVLHESIFGPNKDEKLPADAKIAVVHGTDSASMSTLEHLKETAEQEGALDRLVIEAVTPDTYAIHHYQNSWFSPKAFAYYRTRTLLINLFGYKFVRGAERLLRRK